MLVIGVGNWLLSDEGLGVHVARALAAAEELLPPGVEVLDAGTSLFAVAREMEGRPHVFIVDAVQAGREPGTLYRLDRVGELLDEAGQAPALSLHEWGLADALRAARAVGSMPVRLTLLGAEPERVTPGTELSPRIAEAAQRLVALLREEVASLAAAG